MTTSDSGAAADRSQEDLPDPEPLSQPADPWLTEAPTSVIGEPTPVLYSDTAQFADTAPLDDGPSGGETPQPRRRRRPVWWVLTALAACALFIAGMLAIDQFGSGNDNDARKVAPSRGSTRATTIAPTRSDAGQQQPTAGSAPSVIAGEQASNPERASQSTGPMVVYQITVSGSGNTGSVSYIDQDGDIIRRNGIPLPWRTTFPVGTQTGPLVLDAQRTGGTETGPVTCTITVDGKVLSSTTVSGRRAAPLCSGSR